MLPVVVNVKNTGTVAGDEIVMAFVSFPNTTVQRRQGQKELKGFARVSLAAGESKQVTIPVRLADLDYFQMDSPTARTGQWVVESGPVKIMVGDSSTNLPLSGSGERHTDTPSDPLNENSRELVPVHRLSFLSALSIVTWSGAASAQPEPDKVAPEVPPPAVAPAEAVPAGDVPTLPSAVTSPAPSREATNVAGVDFAASRTGRRGAARHGDRDGTAARIGLPGTADARPQIWFACG